MKKLRSLIVLGVVPVLLLASATTASAHNLYIETDVNPEIPAEQEVQVHFGHPQAPEGCYAYSMQYARVYRPDGTTVDLELKEESGYRTAKEATYWTAEVTLDQEGDYLIVAQRGSGPFDPTWHGGSGPCEFINEWAKVIVHGGGEEQWHKAVGIELEIVPLANPHDLAVGDTFTAKVLYNGEPVRAEYAAAHQTESIHDPEAAQVGQTTEDGTFSVYISKPGMWTVKGVYTVEEPGTWIAAWDGAFYSKGDNFNYDVEKNQTIMTIWASSLGPAVLGPAGPQGPQGEPGPQGPPGPAGGSGWAYAAFGTAILALVLGTVSLALKRRS